jgi:hypothetical protein
MTRIKTQAANLYNNKQYSDKSLNLFILVFRLLQFMNQKTTLLVLGLTLAIVAALAVAPIVNELAYAGAGTGGTGGKGANGVTGGDHTNNGNHFGQLANGGAATGSKPGAGGAGNNQG